MLRRFRGSNMWSVVIRAVLLCSFLIYFFASKFTIPPNSEHYNTMRGIYMAQPSIELPKRKHYKPRVLMHGDISDEPNPTVTQKLFDSRESELHHSSYGKIEPDIEYEILRRRVRQTTQELWNYFSSELIKMNEKVYSAQPELINEIKNVMELGAEHKRSLISDIERMQIMDGYEQWRHDEAKSLSDLVQRRLHYLQNPWNCNNARKLVCKLNKEDAGFAFELHHAVFCFILAYATERTLILTSNWKYKAAWEDVFHPVSETCLNIDTTIPLKKWPGQHDEQVLEYQIEATFVSKPPYLPLSIPADLAQRLTRLTRDPVAWWVGQFLKYLLRPSDATHEVLETRMKKLEFKKPIVGVQIRRTDKIGTEANFHSIGKYMTYVEDYFRQLEMHGINIKRRVFIASDEAGVIDEARKKYPSYEIIGDLDIARMAAVSTRYTDSSLYGIVSDIHMLSLCDYVVCTFTSNICRVVYEIMQSRYPDASNRVKSLDDIYFFTRPIALNHETILSHYPRYRNEIFMKLGDQINIAFNLWNGYSAGTNTRTNRRGIFPSFKVIEKIQTIKFPTYANVK